MITLSLRELSDNSTPSHLHFHPSILLRFSFALAVMAPTQHPALCSSFARRAANEQHTRSSLIQGVAIGLVLLAFIICTLRLTIRLKRRTASYEDSFIAIAMVRLDICLVLRPSLTLLLLVVLDSGERCCLLGYVHIQSGHCGPL